MYGTNPIAKSRNLGFSVHSMFYTIQGEGPFVGQPAVFLRLAGCNLRCFWCDTEFDKGAQEMGAGDLAADLERILKKNNCNFVVITGGEPMLQPLRSLIELMPRIVQFQIETAGTVWPEGGLPASGVSIVCSPKTPSILPMLRTATTFDVYWKYIVKADEPISLEDGLPMMSTQIKDKEAKLCRPDYHDRIAMKKRIYVQGCDESPDAAKTEANVNLAKEIALTMGYRLSLQTHKILGLA